MGIGDGFNERMAIASRPCPPEQLSDAARNHEALARAATAHDTAALNRLSRQAEQGILTLRVTDVLPATRATDAHRRLEAAGLRGCLVLKF